MAEASSAGAASPAFRGMMPIMPTTITRNGTLDEASQRRVVQYCLDHGAVAIGHFGIASEFHKIPDDDRRRLIEVIVEEVDWRVPVFIGVTAQGVRTAIAYAEQAERLGANLIMAALPYVNLPDREGAFAYYQALSDATSLPIIIQDTPASSSILSAELLWKMLREIVGVRHVKAEGKNFLEKTAELLRLSEGGISVIGGAGGRHLIHLLRLGVTAFMTGTEALDLHGGAARLAGGSYGRGGGDLRPEDSPLLAVLPRLPGRVAQKHAAPPRNHRLPGGLGPTRIRFDERGRSPRVRLGARAHRARRAPVEVVSKPGATLSRKQGYETTCGHLFGIDAVSDETAESIRAIHSQRR